MAARKSVLKPAPRRAELERLLSDQFELAFRTINCKISASALHMGTRQRDRGLPRNRRAKRPEQSESPAVDVHLKGGGEPAAWAKRLPFGCMLVLREENEELYDRIEEKNLIRQYDLLTNCIEIGLSQGSRVFDKYMLWDLKSRGRSEHFSIWR